MRKTGSLLFFAALLSGFFVSCNKEEVKTNNFTTITSRDDSCNIIGAPDPTDWTHDSTWTAQELALMSFKDANFRALDSASGQVMIWPACPNPSNGAFYVPIYNEKSSLLKMVCVNTDMQVLYYKITNLPSGFNPQAFNLDRLSAFRAGNSYRLYYAIYNARDTLYYKGHGDLRIE